MKVSIYKFSKNKKNYINTIELKPYKRLSNIYKSILKYLNIQENEQNKKIVFYVFYIESLNITVNESEIKQYLINLKY